MDVSIIYIERLEGLINEIDELIYESKVSKKYSDVYDAVGRDLLDEIRELINGEIREFALFSVQEYVEKVLESYSAVAYDEYFDHNHYTEVAYQEASELLELKGESVKPDIDLLEEKIKQIGESLKNVIKYFDNLEKELQSVDNT